MRVLPRLSLSAACLLASFALAAAPITQIVIKAEPKDAEVWVDGAFKSKDAAAAVVVVSPGKHTVEIRKPGMQSASRSIDIGEGVTEQMTPIVLQPEPLPDFATLLNPAMDALTEDAAAFATRVQKSLAEFNRHAGEGDPNYRAGWLTLDKTKYDANTGQFPGTLEWEAPLRPWRGGPSQAAVLTLPKDQPQQRKDFWETGEAMPQASAPTPQQSRFPVFVRLKQEAGRTVLERIVVRGSGKAGKEWPWPVKTEQTALAQTNTAPNQATRDCPQCPDMVRIPSLGIAIGQYEVTQAQWRAVMGINPSEFTACGDHCPVESVSWDDVQVFIGKLNQWPHTGKPYRLPTEKEWEAACRAGGQHEYCGSNDVEAVAWYDSNSGKSTHPVGQKTPNAWGLYDMSGNVEEWTQDCWDGDCGRRAVRGGSWGGIPGSVRPAYRAVGGPTLRYSRLGFRLAQD
ncbi:MAG: formylglycine-generating enzyme family protein [Candidatus Methylumidiphilus sp.]